MDLIPKLLSKRYFMIGCLFFSAFLWGSGIVVLKESVDAVHPLNLMLIRFSLTTIFVFAYQRGKGHKPSKKGLKGGFIIGTLMFLVFLTQAYGIQYTTASKQAFLLGSNILLVPLLSWMLRKETIDMSTKAGVGIALVGIYLLTGGSQMNVALGDILSLICAFCIACHVLAVGQYQSEIDGHDLFIWQFIFASVWFGVIWLIVQPEMAKLTLGQSSMILYLAVFPTLIAFAFQNFAQKTIEPTTTALILSFESVFGAILARIFLKEYLTTEAFIGCVCIFSAIVITEMKPLNRLQKCYTRGFESEFADQEPK